MTLKEPRIAPLTESELDDETKEILERLRRGGKIFNIFGTLARHPQLLQRWLVFGGHILGQNSLPPRDRELVILRTGWLCRAEYEWGHHKAIGGQVGISAEDIARVTAGPNAPGWTETEAALLRGVDDLHANKVIGDDTWAMLAAHYNTQQLMDMVFTVGQYTLVSMALNTFGVQLEDGFEGFTE